MVFVGTWLGLLIGLRLGSPASSATHILVIPGRAGMLFPSMPGGVLAGETHYPLISPNELDDFFMSFPECLSSDTRFWSIHYGPDGAVTAFGPQRITPEGLDMST